MFIYRKNRRNKKNKDRTDDKNKEEKCFRGWTDWRFHGWLNVWLTDTGNPLGREKYVNGNRVDVLVERKIL